ncbi:o-succinylbenzoate synthase [Nonomuraea sp. NPDC050394]|uniref:o-succinylbenzoate synthase n=1 Tax=Nonomuraea sp. NPDC050394 TaxID=3364363 RepID=UPI00379CF5E7
MSAGRVVERSPVVFRIPMRERFRGQTVREGVLIHGPAGWGEFSPFPEYGPRECSRWLACAREAADEGWPAPVRAAVPVNSTIPAVPPDKAFQLVRRAGCATAKVKVAERGQNFAEDLARVEAVRDALGPSGKLRVDANGAWSVDEAVRRLRDLGRFDLEYAEQPCATLDELAQVRRRCDVPIAADESIRKAEDPLRVRAAEAADVAVVKVQPLGGVRNALRVVESCGLPAVVSSAVESSVGLAAGLALAAALPELPYACGLGTMTLLSGDVVKDSLMPVDGQIAVRRPNVDFSYLSEFEIESPSWLRRMQEAAP